jgi:hypothetical protein
MWFNLIPVTSIVHKIQPPEKIVSFWMLSIISLENILSLNRQKVIDGIIAHSGRIPVV